MTCLRMRPCLIWIHRNLIVLGSLLPIQSFEICVMFIASTLIVTKALTCDKNLDELKQTELYF